MRKFEAMRSAPSDGAETASASRGAKRPSGVQSIERAFELLETMAEHGGTMGVSQLAIATGLPLPTIHRLVRTLVGLGYLRQEPSRQYVLAPKLIRLGEQASKMIAIWAHPHLEHLASELGESANLAMLDGDEIVYVAHAQSRQSMRMFTEVGRRVPLHCTAVGKAIVAQLPPTDVRAMIERTGMPKQTPNTLGGPDQLLCQLKTIASNGYAIDDGEQEVGVRCVAVAVPEAPSRLAMSISGPATRMTPALITHAVPLLTTTAAKLSAELRAGY